MERLTKNINGVTVYIGPGNEFDYGMIPAELLPDQVRIVMRRLAEYEDTGLSPEQIRKVVGLLDDSVFLLYSLKELLDSSERCTRYIQRCYHLMAEMDKHQPYGFAERTEYERTQKSASMVT